MADQMPILNRQQLAQFLPSHEAIKAFESLFRYVSQTAPNIADDVSVIIAAIRNPSSSFKDFSNRLESLEQSVQRNANSNKEILRRLDELEQLIGKKSNDTDIVRRLQNLESIVGV